MWLRLLFILPLLMVVLRSLLTSVLVFMAQTMVVLVVVDAVELPWQVEVIIIITEIYFTLSRSSRTNSQEKSTP